VTIVTNRWHLPRALLAARMLGMAAAGSGPRGALPPAKLMKAYGREVVAVPKTACLVHRLVRRESSRPRLIVRPCPRPRDP
jgi:uncharacterized SAM-binding protein YcdF (DUF218 family)